MKSQFIAVVDSGIGGLSVLKELVRTLPNERFLYFGDKKNFPYGNKNKNELFDVVKNNLKSLREYNLKALVLACNTLSVNLLSEIESYSKLKTFGVFPPVREYYDKKTLLLCTNLTASNFKSSELCHVVGLKRLARDIELNAHNLSSIDIVKHMQDDSVGNFVDQKGYYSTIILGCTHYEFVKNQIYDHFQPQKIVSGVKNTVHQLEKYLKQQKSSVNIKQNQILFIGDYAQQIQNIWVFGGRKC